MARKPQRLYPEVHLQPDKPLNEREWQRLVLKWARDLGWDVQTISFSPYSTRGILDAQLCRPPRYMQVEFKTDRGRLRPEQEKWIENLRACGIEVHVWRPRDEQLVLGWLR